MIDQLKNLDKIYDLLALCSSYILNEISNNPYEFSLFSDEEYFCVYNAVESYCYDKQQKGHRKAFNELRDFLVSYMKTGITVEKCFAVVKYIDELVEVEIDYKLLEGKHVIKYSSLNEQYKDNVRIIPKTKESFLVRGNINFMYINEDGFPLFRGRRKCACSSLDRETLNYMIWDKEHIKRYPMCIYRFDEKSPISKHFFDREEIVFGIIPFTNRSGEEIFGIEFCNKTFYINQMNKETEMELKEKYVDICKRCKKEDIDFLIFPELLMTENIISSIKEKNGIMSLPIIVNGSIWKDFVNRTIITDGNGKEIATYCKKEPYKFKKGDVEYKEHLDQNKNKEYSVIEIDGLGRIGFGICKDLINEEIKLFHKYVGTDILIIPSFTKSLDLQASAEELSKEYNCIVVVANACSALEKKQKSDGKIGFITLPAKLNSSRAVKNIDYYYDKCCEECRSKCLGKKIAINFLCTQNYPEGLTFEVKEKVF